MSSAIHVFLTLSVLLSSTSLLLTACDTSSLPVSNLAETSTGRAMAPPFVPGEVLVKFKPSVSPARIDAILKDSGAELIAEIKGIGVHHVRIVGKESVESVVTKLSTFQEVEYVEPNFRFRTQ
jgi:thermitase